MSARRLRPGRSSTEIILLALCALCLFTILNSMGHVPRSTPESEAGLRPLSTPSSPAAETDENDAAVRFCRGTQDFYPVDGANRTRLERLYWDAYEYHNEGGNLEAMERFLNRALDRTYDIRGLGPFTMGGANNPLGETTSASEQIISELRKQDKHGLGGYRQHNLPGKFTGPMATKDKMASESGGRFVNVLAPVTQERWDVAMGPTLPMNTCLGYKVLEGPPKRRYEDKYICGWRRGPFLSKEAFALQREGGSDTASAAREGCNVMSIGSNDQWGFETRIIADTGCRVATFDCTVTNPRNKPKSEQVKFYSHCISATEENYQIENRTYVNYFDLLRMAGFIDANSNDPTSAAPRVNYMKMDVEGYEYDVLANMIRQARKRNLWYLLPDQLQVEFHYVTWMYDLGWSLRMRDTGELAAFFSMLFREAGYVAVHIDKLDQFPTLREVLFLRIFC